MIGAAMVMPVVADESVAAAAPPMVTPLVPETPGVVPRAPVVPRVRVPELIIVEPTWVLAPERVRELPVFVRLVPAPVIADEMV